MKTKMKFSEGINSEFYSDVKARTKEYFSSRKISSNANAIMIAKTIFIIMIYLGFYGLLITNTFNIITGIIYCILLGFTHPLFFINIGHDAMHNTYSKKSIWNKILPYSLNLIGLNTYINKRLHLIVHHNYPSIEGYDIVVEEYSILRLSKNQPYKKYHKYQAYYAPLIYSLFSIFLIFSIDFVLFKRTRMGNVTPIIHPKSQWVRLYIGKILYLFFALLLPLLVIDVSWYWIVLGFIVIHMISGVMLSIVGVLNHQIDDSIFPEPNLECIIVNSKKNHELEVTIDFSPYNRFALWYFGGFNTHVAHHLFPEVCHVHYIPITKIIEERAPVYGLKYQQKTLRGSINSHFKYLKRLSKNPIEKDMPEN